MADYWVSQPRKFCEICKCWFADNKASIDFHERGNRHQANVKRNLREARKRTETKEQEKLDLLNSLQAIEVAALQAYQKDLGVEDGEAKKPAKPVDPSKQPHYQSKPQVSRPMHHTPSTRKTRGLGTKAPTGVPPPPPPGPPPPPPSGPPPPQWMPLMSPEGYPYYLNTITGESQWEAPPELEAACSWWGGLAGVPLPTAHPACLQPATEGLSSCSAAEQTCQVASESMSCAEGKAAGEGAVRKRTADQESCVPPKRGGGPYGGWTTVEQRTQEEDEEGTNEGGEGREERGGAVSSDDEDVEVLTFQEKTLAAPGPMAPGSFKGFGFRKKLGGARTHFRTKNTHAFT